MLFVFPNGFSNSYFLNLNVRDKSILKKSPSKINRTFFIADVFCKTGRIAILNKTKTKIGIRFLQPLQSGMRNLEAKLIKLIPFCSPGSRLQRPRIMTLD